MYLEVYIDVVFMVNFVMDFIILLLERKVCRRHVSIYRIFLGAFVGAALMCIITIIPKLNYIVYLALSYLVSSVVIVKLTFKPKKIIELLKLTFILYGIAVVLGGIIFFLYYYANIGYGLNRIMNQKLLNTINIQVLLLLAFGAIIIFVVFTGIISRISNITTKIYDINLCYKDKTVTVNALLDTGNNLYDPISRWPVIIGEISVLHSLFNDIEYLELEKMCKNMYDIDIVTKANQILGLKTRLIPFSSLGKENGMLLGIVLDKVVVYKGKEVKTNENVVIGIYNKSLSNDNSYSILLHPELV